MAKPKKAGGKIQVAIRLSPDIVERIDALIPGMEDEPMVRAVGRKVSRAIVIRLLIHRGLWATERSNKKRGK